LSRRGWIVVFAKEPSAGRVKTRFTPPFSPAEAAGFYGALLEDVLHATRDAALTLGLDPVLAVDPPDSAARIAAGAPRGFRVVAQAPGALGARMSVAVHQGFAAGAPFVLLRGSDSPCIGAAELGAAIEALEGWDMAASPDADGGYGLVGVASRKVASQTVHTLFDHTMSTPSALADTVARARAASLSMRLLPPGFDLDRFDDLRRLEGARRVGAAVLCPRTLAYLDERGLWPALPGPSDGA
jgi:hypothetical protein